MKVYILILLFLTSNLSFGQLTIDEDLARQFEAEIGKFEASFQKDLEDLLGRRGLGAVIFYEYSEDTLNKEQLIQRSTHIRVSDIDGNEKDSEIQSLSNFPVPASAKLSGDTLSIWPAYLMLNGFEHLIVSAKSINSGYWQYNKYDSIFQQADSEKFTNKLRVNAKTSIFKLSTDKFTTNSWLYGLADFESSPYYIIDDNFTGKKRKMKIKAVYIFKVRI